MFKNNKINLFKASRWGHEQTVKLLLEAGADRNIKNIIGDTALHWGKSKFND